MGDTIDNTDCCMQYGRQLLPAGQLKNAGHTSLQVAMSGPALAQEAFFGINVATLIPQLAFD